MKYERLVLGRRESPFGQEKTAKRKGRYVDSSGGERGLELLIGEGPGTWVGKM